MPNVHTTLTSLFTAIANAIRGKTESSAQIVADNFPDAISAIPSGTPLPTLTDPATAADILAGKEVILPDANNEPVLVTGSLVPPTDTGENGLLKQFLHRSVSTVTFYDTELTDIGDYGLYGLRRGSSSNIQFGEFENVQSISQYGLGGGATRVPRLKFNATVAVGVNAFRENTRLKVADFAAITTTTASKNCFADTGLEALIIRSNTLCPLATPDFIVSGASPLSESFGIYVPPALVTQYETATNWDYYSNYIYPFYLAASAAEVDELIADTDIPYGSMIICDSASYNSKYTVKE